MKETRAADKTGHHELAKHFLRWQLGTLWKASNGASTRQTRTTGTPPSKYFDARLEDIRQKCLKCAEGSHNYEFYKELYNALTYNGWPRNGACPR